MADVLCGPDPLAEAKAAAKARIKREWKEQDLKPFHTGIMGSRMQDCSLEEMEAAELVTDYGLEARLRWREKPAILALALLSGAEGMGDMQENLLSDDKAWLEQGVITPHVAELLSNRSVVLRDAENRYIEVKFKDVLTIGMAMAQKADADLMQKWKLEELINNAESVEAINSIHWDMDYSDVDSKGE